MTEEERRRFESLESLRAAAYESLNDRRGYEWKLSLSIWTALAIFLAGLVQPAKDARIFPLQGDYVWLVFAGVSLGMVVLHALWSDYASRAKSMDWEVLLHFREEMVNNMLKLPFSDEIDRQIKEHRPAVGWSHRSHLVQICITALMALATVLIVYARSS